METNLVKLANINEPVLVEAVKQGYSDNQARIIASKLGHPEDIKRIIEANLNNIPCLDNLTDIKTGASLIHKHVQQGNHIALVTDSDMDGISSAYILYKGLVHILGVKEENITVIINKRKNGNGITEKLLVTIMDEHTIRPIDLVITGDHGSANGPTIKKMMDVGMEVVITDHHLVPKENNAYNANAFINPQKEPDCVYRFVSGCAVAYFLIVKTKVEFEEYYSDADDWCHKLLPVVAASTIGDSMQLHDPINRALVDAGLKEMNSLKDYLWQAFKYTSNCPGLFTEEFLSFNLIPKINSCNRMGNPMLAFEFYTSKDYQDAVINFDKLGDLDTKRKKLQKDMVKDANFQLFDSENKKGLTIVLERGAGIEGVVSSIIGAKFYKPTITFVKHEDSWGGSARAINDDFHLHNAMTAINEKDPDMFFGFGGHKGACGCKIKLDKINDFKRMFNEEVEIQLAGKDSSKRHSVIGAIDHEHLNESIIEDIRAVAPFGIGFDKVKYVGIFTIEKIWYIGREKESVNIRLGLDTGEKLDCFVYNSQSMFDHDILAVDKRVKVVYTPKLDSFRGNIEFKLGIEYIEEI